MRIGVAASLLGLGILSASTASAVTVRADHPRLLFGNGTGFGTTVAQFTSRCTGNDPVYANRCKYIGGGQANPNAMPGSADDAVGWAAGYLLWKDPQRCTNAAGWLLTNLPMNGPTDGTDPHAFIVANGRSAVYMAVVRDWCDAALDDATKSALEDRLATWSDWFIGHYGTTGPSTEPADVFHDDYANVESAIAFTGLILAGTSHDAQAQTALAHAEMHWKTVILPAMAYSGDWWPEGFTYVQPTLGGLAWYAAGWSTATDENIYDYVKASAGDLFDGYFDFFAYAQRPDDDFVYIGDTTHTKQTNSLFIKPLVDLLNYGTNSPLGQGFSKAVTASTTAKNGFCDDVACADGWLVPLLYDSSKDATATDLSTLPTARWIGKGTNDVAVLRSGWGVDDTYVWMSCGDYFGAHQHDEVGGFQIFRHTMLTGPTGAYDDFDTTQFDNYYSQHSVHANTIAIYSPGESFPTSQTITLGATANVNDGGQRVLRRTDEKGVIGAYSTTDLATYLTNKSSGPFDETGNITTFEHAACHDYVACDMTAAYDSTNVTTSDNAPKVKEVVRQLVFVRPEIVVVFDRVESLDPSFEKRFLLHASATGVMPAVNGNKLTIDNGGGRLLGQTLLPTSATLNVVTNFTVAGMPYPPNANSTGEPEMGGNRIEVVPKTPATRDYFLHVFDATDPSKSDLPATVAETVDTATVTITDGSNSYVIAFNKTGTVGGHIKVTGAMMCDQDLGADASPGPDAGLSDDGGSANATSVAASSGSGATGAGGGAGAGAPDASGGCGCRTSSSSDGAAALLMLGIAGAVAARRRRGGTNRESRSG